MDIFDFLCDPFGIERRRDRKALEEYIKFAKEQSKKVDQGLIGQDKFMVDQAMANLRNVRVSDFKP